MARSDVDCRTPARHCGALVVRAFGALAACGAAWMLTGCSDLTRSTSDAMRAIGHGRGAEAPTAAEVSASPYYQLQVSGSAGNAVLILGNRDGTREAWYGAGGVVLFVDRGRVVQTVGLAQNLDGMRVSGVDPFARGLQRLDTPITYSRREDWSPGYRYDVPVQATVTPAGIEPVTILGTTRTLRRVDERIDSDVAGYRADNRYWVDPQDGRVWKSEQQIAPGVRLTLVQLKPYPVTTP